MAFFPKIGVYGTRGFFTTTVPSLQRCFFTSSHVLQSLPKQKVTISPELRKTLLGKLQGAAQQEKPNQFGCNCLPLKGTPEFEKMAEEFISRVKEAKAGN